MRLGAGLTSAKLTLFFRSSTTGWTTDSEYLFGAEFSLHGKKITPRPFTGMVNLEQFRQLLDYRVGFGAQEGIVADWVNAGEPSNNRRFSRAWLPRPSQTMSGRTPKPQSGLPTLRARSR